MNRPRWFPPLRPDTEPSKAQAILDCQGMWWLWGGSICRKPELCVQAMECYFVKQVAKHKPGAIHWSPGFDPPDKITWSSGFDPEPVTLELWGAA